VAFSGAAVVLAGCAASQPSSLGGAPMASTISTRPSKVMVVVLENHGVYSALRRMPFLAAQTKAYGNSSNYYAVTHPSLPNYLALAGGSTFGVTDDKNPSSHRLVGASVFGQVIAGHRTAKTYAEDMTRNCQQTNIGRYAVRHNPWAYFASPGERALCLKYNVPSGTTAKGNLHTDVVAGRLPSFSMLIPDVCHDGHDCSLATTDVWLKAWLRQIEAAPDFRAGRLAVVVTFDEDDRFAANHVLTSVIHPARRGVVVKGRLTHYSLSATASRLAGAPPLRRAAGTPDFLAAFRLR
jgi:phospholipase C